MKAIILKEPGGVENLIETDLAIPVVGDDEVLIQVKAISINPVDVKTRAGKGMYGRFKELNPLILGWDISGVITETGKNGSSFKKGDEVFGMVNFPGHGKAYAEYIAAPASHIALKPSGISHAEAAAATLAALTAWQALVTKANIQPGNKVLIHAASGGVGHYAVQLAKHLGAYVIGTSSAANRELVLKLGADQHIDYQSQRLQDAVQDVDFVLDAIGGDVFDSSISVVKHGGTIISIPSGLPEALVEKARQNGINGYFFLVQSNGEDMKRIADFLDRKIIRSHIHQTFLFHDMGNAHLLQETGRAKGKVVVTL
jgi:NADPH:quinone reductase-like Zn-dependent oxidoreductase